MTIEKLTEDERDAVRRGTCQASGPKALRIIDAQASALAEARAECERLRAQSRAAEQRWLRAERGRVDAESRLIAANALLERVVKYASEDNARTPGSTRLARALDDIRAHLADQEPVAGYPETFAQRVTDTFRTEAEQRVLDAMADIRQEAVTLGANVGMMSGVSAVCRAELARRGLKST